MISYAPLTAAHGAEGHQVQWTTWPGDGLETTTIRWENEGFTVSGQVGDAPGREHIQYVLRLTASWQVRQFLLFRDLEEPDLWLATDGSGRWGEMNGAHRTELDGCYDVDMLCTPLTHTLPIRRLPLSVCPHRHPAGHRASRRACSWPTPGGAHRPGAARRTGRKRWRPAPPT